MGYRSEVKLCLKKDTAKELKERLINGKFDYMLSNPFYQEIELEKSREVYPEDTVVMIWESIKWYDSYPEIQLIEGYLDELDEQEKEYYFIRVGEEYNDIETREYYGDGSCARLGVYQEIEIYY